MRVKRSLQSDPQHSCSVCLAQSSGGCSPQGFGGVEYPFKDLTRAGEEVLSYADTGMDEIEKEAVSSAWNPIEETDNEILPPRG